MYQPLFSAELFNMRQPFFQQTPTFHSPLGRPATPRKKRLSVASVRPGRVNMTGCWPKKCLGGGFKYFVFSTLLGEMIQFDYIICFKWVETIFLQSPARLTRIRMVSSSTTNSSNGSNSLSEV